MVSTHHRSPASGPSPGGAAAINGFLYQLLSHLQVLATVTFTRRLRGGTIHQAQIVLEPVGGGDARALGSGHYLVEQYKTRTNKTWSIADLTTVLRDLRRAVPNSLPEHGQYRFVTDGRSGRLGAFEAFLADIRQASGPESLDQDTRRRFGNGQYKTNQAFFWQLNADTREDLTDGHARLFHLLARFCALFRVTQSALEADIDELLHPYAPDPADVLRHPPRAC